MGNKQPALTTDGRRHFSLFKQVDQLVGASEAVPDLAYLHRILALCSLPRTDPGDAKEFARVNGPITLGMIAGLHNKLPYGNIPRLLLVWTCTEATQKQSRELLLGDSLSAFLEKLKHSRECTRVCSPRMTHPALCPVFILGVRQGGNERLVRRTRPQLLEKPCARCAWMMTKSQILLFPVPNPVPSVGNFKRAQKGHSS